jgi:UDP-glucose 4-epimerase
MDKGKLVVVTGGAGFIGSHLCERLVKDGHRVISLDNYFTGSRENHVPGVEYREGHTKDIETLIPEHPSIVYHLGEYSRVAQSIEEPALVWDLNTRGTMAVLEFCRTRKCKIVYAGSSTKFAKRIEGGREIEGRSLSPYTWSKAANTELVRSYHEWYGIPYATVYFYNVYGPREMSGRYGTVIEIFRQKRIAGDPLPLRLPGTQTRTYTHVLDTVDGIILAGERGEGDDYGIASDDTFSLRELAEVFGGPIEELPERSTSRSFSEVDAEKMHALGWQQKHHLTDYIRESLDGQTS